MPSDDVPCFLTTFLDDGIEPMAIRMGFFIACFTLAGASSTLAVDWSAAGPMSTQTVEFPDLQDASRSRRIPIKVHYPEGMDAVPVIVFSHGGGGHWDANFAQAKHLASHGFAVLCLEHVGSNTEVLRSSFRFGENLKAMTRDANEVLGRPKDVSFALDRAAEWQRSHPKLKGRFDFDRIGAIGHSFGAYTTLVVCGARPALNWLEPSQGTGLGPDLRDPRIRCGVALSIQGPGEPFFIESSYASVKVPMLAISGSNDKQQGANPENRRRGFQLLPEGDKTLVWIANADHTAFSDATGSKHRMLPSDVRAEVQPIARAATVVFFKHQLQTDEPPPLSVELLSPYAKGKTSSVEVLHR